MTVIKAWESTASTLEDLSMLALASYNVGVTGLKNTIWYQQR